ncbi:MAG: GNAT family N-acetyltransferase, partial [Pseudomonadota bacterium]
MAQSGRIRPFATDDVDQVVKLFDLAYLSGAGETSNERSALFRRVFFETPDRSEGALTSLVWEDSAGHVFGFCGAHPRRFVQDGNVILAAAPGQLMVAPELRGRGIGVALVRAFFAGRQSFTFSGSAGDATRAITGAIGAVNPALRGI